jgi:hypothetical protein
MYMLYDKSLTPQPIASNTRLETNKTNNESKIYLACWEWNLPTPLQCTYLIFAYTTLYSRSIASKNAYREFARVQSLFTFRKVVSFFSRVIYYCDSSGGGW